MMPNDNPKTEALQNPPETAGASRSPDAASIEEQILSCADYTYLYRRQAVLDASEDEEKFLSAFKDFQKAAFKLSSHTRALQRCCEDINMRVTAIDILERVRMDTATAVLTAQCFEVQRVDAGDFVHAAPVANLKLDGISLYDRLSVTIKRIKSGKDAELAIQLAHEKAIEEIAPKVQHTFDVTREKPFSPFYTYPIPLPPEDEPLPEFPAAFVRLLFLPPEDMERYPNGAFKVPQGYRDKTGEDLTHLWEVDWENGGRVLSGPTEEENLHGARQWVCWCRETPAMEMPPDCLEFYSRQLEKELGLRKPDSPS